MVSYAIYVCTHTHTCGEGGVVGKKAWTVVMRGEKKIGKVKEESYPSIEAAFTLPQLQELQRQTLIHRHLAAGLPVPVHLVLPIWKSVAASLGFFKQFPSYIGHSRQGFDYWHMMEPDPGRCRRTDGKKWRCSKNVIVDQKYCERHMHRGCQRSRKLVEASEVASPSNPTTTRPEKSKGKTPQNPSSNLLGLQLMTTSSNVTNINHGSSTTIASNLGKKRVSYVTSPFINANTTSGSGTRNSAIATNYSNPVFTSIKCNQNTVKDMGEVYLGNTGTIKGSSTNNTNVSVGRNMSPVLGFFPKSVLQVVRHDGRCIDNRNGMEREPGRCRRTDGKKWRCRGDIIPDQKYCARHMHRGVKKLAKAVEPPTSSASTKTVPVPLVTPSSCRVDHPSPNTNLSISITTSPPPISKDEKSDSGNSSDTTITDTSICAYAISKLPA